MKKKYEWNDQMNTNITIIFIEFIYLIKIFASGLRVSEMHTFTGRGENCVDQ